MKLVKDVPPRCDCMTRLHDFESNLGRLLEIGSIVECDCGQSYIKQDSQRDGIYWARHQPQFKVCR